MSHIKLGLIGGTGLGKALANESGTQRHDVNTPFGKPSDAIIETTWAGVPILLLSRHGPGHLLNPSAVPFRANIFALKQLGCTHIIASGAVGSLREEFRPRDLVVADQVIDKTNRRISTFYEKAAVHVEFAEPFCPVLRKILLEAGQVLSTSSGQAEIAASGGSPEPFKVHDRGTYTCMEGPAFSSRAESLMHRLWGGDLIGMTAMPEAKLAKEAEIAYALVALVTDYDCWRTPPKPKEGEPQHADPAVLLKEIIHNLEMATANAVKLIRRAVDMISQNPDALLASPALHALQLAIWSDKSAIDAPEVQRLGTLWMKYFT